MNKLGGSNSFLTVLPAPTSVGTRMNSSCYFKRGARSFPVNLSILLGIRLASVFACNGDLNSFNTNEFQNRVVLNNYL